MISAIVVAFRLSISSLPIISTGEAPSVGLPLIKEPVSYSTNDFVSYDIYNKTTNNNLFIDEYRLNPFILNLFS